MPDATISPAADEEVRSGDGQVAGGWRDFVCLRWLQTEVLSVDAPVRGTGVGSLLATRSWRRCVTVSTWRAR